MKIIENRLKTSKEATIYLKVWSMLMFVGDANQEASLAAQHVHRMRAKLLHFVWNAIVHTIKLWILDKKKIK